MALTSTILDVMSTSEEVKAAAHQLGAMLAEAHADFYDVVEAFSEGYAEGRAATGERVFLVKLGALNELQSVSNNTITDYVQDARAAHVSWSQIGDALDVSRQAAQQRYGQ